jgi:hypothetical protein
MSDFNPNDIDLPVSLNHVIDTLMNHNVSFSMPTSSNPRERLLVLPASSHNIRIDNDTKRLDADVCITYSKPGLIGTFLPAKVTVSGAEEPLDLTADQVLISVIYLRTMQSNFSYESFSNDDLR